MTKVVHCRKAKYDVYIGRPSIWGNPYSHLPKSIAETRVSSRQEALELYREYLMNTPELLEKLPTLRNKTLGCWCKPQDCHGDILIEVLEEIYGDS